jgi:hypothetical protein
VAKDSGKNVRRLLVVIVEVDGVVADINIIFKMGVKIRARRRTFFLRVTTHVQCALLFLYFIYNISTNPQSRNYSRCCAKSTRARGLII